MTQNLNADDLGIPLRPGEPLSLQQRQAPYLNIARRGYWTMNANKDGRMLLETIGHPVRKRDGSRLVKDVIKQRSGTPALIIDIVLT